MGAGRAIGLLLAAAWGCAGATEPMPVPRSTATAVRADVVPPSTSAEASLPTPTAAPPAAPAAPTGVASFLSVGDFILSRVVERTMKSEGDRLYPFRGMAEAFLSVDFTFGNLESPLPALERFPLENLEGLTRYRFRVLNLANNHAMDRREEGLWYTLDRLHERGILTVGAGRDLDEAWAPAVVEVGGIRIGFVGASYTSSNWSRKLQLTTIARIDHRQRLAAAMDDIRGRADFVVATMHAGVEYISVPVGEQTLFAYAAIDRGADVVIGTHPHVVQRVEVYRGRPIFYSLGNFIFDQHRPPEVKEAVVVKTQLRRVDGGAVARSFEVVPVIIEGMTRPRPATEEEQGPILRRMGLKSRHLEPPVELRSR